MTIIDCNNRPDFVTKEARGSGYIYSAQFTEASSLSDLSEVYKTNALEDTTPAIEVYGVEETADALATVYAEILSPEKINTYNNIIIKGQATPEIALESLDSQTFPEKVRDVAIVTDENRQLFFENQFPAISDRMKLGVINPIEFAEFAKDVSYGSMENIKDDAKKNRFNLLKLLNFFFGGAAIGSAIGSICSILSNPFSGLTGIIESSLNSISKAMTLKFGFLDILEKAKKLLDIGAQIAKINSFINTFSKGIEGLIDSVKRKVENIIGGINDKLGSFLNGGGIAAVKGFLSNKVRQVQNFFNDTNMKNLVDKAKESIGKFANGFKNFSGKSADFLLASMCKVSSTIQEFLEAPMKSLEQSIASVEGEKNALKNMGDVNTKKAIEGGRPSITKESKEEKLSNWRTAHLEALKSKANKKAQNKLYRNPEPLQEPVDSGEDRTEEFFYEPKKASHPPPTEWKWLTFGGQVLDPVQGGQKFWDADFKVNMVDYGGGYVIPKETGIARDIGYYGIDLEVLERAEALGEALQTKLTITSGFRHKIYNQYLRNTGVGAAKNSQHTKGKALDVVMGKGSYREKFIEMARVHGFKGIGRYRTFVHIDLGPARTWNG